MILASIADDLSELDKSVAASRARTSEGKKTPAAEKPVSVSDADAAIIVPTSIAHIPSPDSSI
jgi:hypothetical protein